MSRNTERKYRVPLTAAGLLEGDPTAHLAELKAVVAAVLSDHTPVARPSSIEDWVESIETMLEPGAGPTAIYDRLRRALHRQPRRGQARLCLRLR